MDRYGYLHRGGGGGGGLIAEMRVAFLMLKSYMVAKHSLIQLEMFCITTRQE